MIENSRNVYEAQFSLIICNEQLDFDDISKKLGLIPTKTITNGTQISRLPLIVAHDDAWYYTIELSNPEGSDEALLGIFRQITNHAAYLRELEAKGFRITLRLSLTTDKAFIGYRLTPATIAAIQESGFPLDITTVSWGETGF